MSYDIYLLNPVTKETIKFDKPYDIQGGTYTIGGTSEAWLNITYNYSKWYYRRGIFARTKKDSEGIRTIYGLSGAESIPILDRAIKKLESIPWKVPKSMLEKDNGYWTPTKENAIKPLYQLKTMAEMCPDGIWDGD